MYRDHNDSDKTERRFLPGDFMAKTVLIVDDDPTQRRPDITKAREELGWEPKVNLEQGLEKTIAYFDGLLKSGAASTKA